jgi:hypothetical protein
MNKLTLALCFFIFGLCGCRDSETTSPASVSSTATGPSAANAAIELSNAEIYFNPTITISVDGLSCTYDNTMNQLSIFPSGTTTCSVTYSDSGDDLVLTLNESSGSVMGGKPLTLNLSGFVDKGGEGLIDEFTVQATHGANTVKDKGQFIGATKPLNKKVASKRSELPSMDGAPTLDEWKRYIIGNAIVAVDQVDGDITLLTFKDSSKVEGFDVQDNEPWDGTYLYSKSNSDPTKGTLVNKQVWTKSDGTIVRGEYEFELTFTNFYSGTWKETKAVENGVPYSQNQLEHGTFNVYTDTSLITKK